VGVNLREPPSIGVLVTYYGERELLRDCLMSLAAQTRPVDEILIYDDASDAPPEPYVPEGLPVRVLRGEVNRGPAYGRNVLLRASHSQYIHFHDADDLFAPEWCERVSREIEARQVDAVFTEIESRDEHGGGSPQVLGLERLGRGGDLVRFCLQGVMLVPSGTYLRDRVMAVGGYRVALWQSEDFDFHVRLALSGLSYAVVPEPLVTIRVRAAGRSQDRVQTWGCIVNAVEALVAEVPAWYRRDLADTAARAGSALYKLGARGEARRAFALAKRLGPPTFQSERRFYRVLARSLGPQAVERISSVYRGLMPIGVRAFLSSRGW
jgi:glycosyltransferase involved in cell wall biosynthesis